MAVVEIFMVVRDLTPEDLPACAWSGSALHLTSIARALEHVRLGQGDYLAACPPSGLPVALGGIDYEENPGAGTLTQLSVHGALQSCGIGTLLIRAAEQRILDHGLHRAELAVEESNSRARALYERLGYIAYSRAVEAWDEQGADGTVFRYETMCTRMRKDLP